MEDMTKDQLCVKLEIIRDEIKKAKEMKKETKKKKSCDIRKYFQVNDEN